MKNIPPKICIFTETYYPQMGGGETQARALAEALTARGFPVIVITRRSDRSFRKVESYGPVTVYRLSPAGRAHYKKWGLLLSALPALIKRRREYDLLFVSGFRVIGIAAMLAGRLLGKSCILKADSPGEMSGDFFRAGLKKLGVNRLMFLFRSFLALRNRILKRADGFVGISTEIIAELQSQGVKREQIHAIPNSVDIARFCPVSPPQKIALRRQLQLPATQKIVIYTGRLVSYKGLPVLLQAWRDLRRIHEDLLLLLVGEGGLDIHNCESDLKAYAAAHEMNGSVRFTGSVANVAAFLQAADIFAFPTEKEAFGISLIEAMACGLPAVSTAAGGVKDILQHRQNGLVVAAGDPQQLCRALDQLITDAPLAARLGSAARQTVADKYAAPAVFDKYEALFRQTLLTAAPQKLQVSHE